MSIEEPKHESNHSPEEKDMTLRPDPEDTYRGPNGPHERRTGVLAEILRRAKEQEEKEKTSKKGRNEHIELTQARLPGKLVDEVKQALRDSRSGNL